MQSDIDLLADYRVRNVRSSEEVVEKGRRLLQANRIEKLGDEGSQHLRRGGARMTSACLG